ncbi:MAG: AraC family transcriptional regulator ligand-binding domain-containing protein [Polyangiales bacterium]
MSALAAANRSESSSDTPRALLGEHAREMQVSAVLPRVLADVVRQRGLALEPVFGVDADARLALPAEQVSPLHEFQAQLARAIELTREPALGLYCGLSANEFSFGLMAPLVAHAATLRGALELVCRFQGLVAVGSRIRLRERSDLAWLELDLVSHSAIDRSFIELAIAGLVRMLQGFGCSRKDIRAVCFPYPRPPHHAVYAKTFGGAERFSHAYAGIELAAEALDRAHVHRDPELHALMLAQAQQRLDRVSRPLSCTERVRSLLVGRSASQLPDMPAAAQALGISVRSLRRRLESEGTTYRDLTQAMLHDSACTLLRNPDITIQAVAHALGFSEVTAFHRAFRRWCQLTPAEYRAANGCAAP